MLKCIIFDCDGVLVDTEKDGHRVAFNKAFKKNGYDIEWDVELYKDLLEIAGGKERMKHYFNTTKWPEDIKDRDAFIKKMHKEKTEIFMELIATGELPLRPGIKRIVDEAIKNETQLAVCSTSNEKAVKKIVSVLLGPERETKFSGIFAGDVVSRKKPDPEIYLLALKELNLKPEECIVVEDSVNGLNAAIGAGIKCLITTNYYTEKEDFSKAVKVVNELGDEPNAQITLEGLRALINKQ